MEYKDYYKTLGVGRSATQDEIKKAYRRLAREFHPDVSQHADAEARFKEINEANEVLGDPEKRKQYDHLGSQWSAGQNFRPPPGWQQKSGEEWTTGASFEGFSDFFESLFGGRADRQRRTTTTGRRMADMTGVAEISLEQAIHGTEVQVSTAKGPAQRVRIPPGASDGSRLRVRGKGAQHPADGAPGDLILEIRIRPDERYRVEGRDLHRDLPITPWEAALGATIAAPTPTGFVHLKIPPDSPSGKVMRLKGRGLPGKEPGDLYLRLMIAVPSVEEAGDWYRKMAKSSTFAPREGLDP